MFILSLSIKLVNYNSENKQWSSIFSRFKRQCTQNYISQEAQFIFNRISQMSESKISNIKSVQDWDTWAKQVGIAVESLKAFMADTKYTEKTLSNYQAYLSQTTTTTTQLSNASRIGSVALKGIAMASNMIAFSFISAGISKGIQFLDDWIHKNEKAIESANNLSTTYQDNFSKISDKISTIERYYDEFTSLSAISIVGL